INLDLRSYGFGMGYQAQLALERANIATNRNTVRNEPSSPFYPSGLRIGTPALTTRGMKEKDMKKVASWIKRVLDLIRGYDLPRDQKTRGAFIKDFRRKIQVNKDLIKIQKEVSSFASKFPVPGIR
ncbi:hypothetical protein HYS93_04270, partial [Candidatus Daviesbacteria bacterium]|nr:hypothetical protein [Candidatus Daviesbacteria bacterium]